MNKREAKAYALNRIAILIENQFCADLAEEVGERDAEKVEKAMEELSAELSRRGNQLSKPIYRR